MTILPIYFERNVTINLDLCLTINKQPYLNVIFNFFLSFPARFVLLLVCSVGNETIAVPFRGPPRYNPKRRSAAWGGWWNAGDRSSLASSTRIPAELDAILRRPQGSTNSPCSLERPFSSASSSISDASHPSHEDDASILTGKTPPQR